MSGFAVGELHPSPNMSTQAPVFLRVLGESAPRQSCASLEKCPNILEMADGSFAVIGEDITESALLTLPTGTGCGPGERVVSVPRSILINARPEIPSA